MLNNRHARRRQKGNRPQTQIVRMEYVGPINAAGDPICRVCGAVQAPGVKHTIHVTKSQTVDYMQCVDCMPIPDRAMRALDRDPPC